MKASSRSTASRRRRAAASASRSCPSRRSTTAVACVAPPAIALSDVGDTTTGWPEAGATYSWIDAAGGDTAGAGAVEQLLQVAANEVDFRGDRGFFYYHQVMEKVESEASKESQRAGPPTGGYRVTIVGAGFLGFDANASTILVALARRAPPPPTRTSSRPRRTRRRGT